MIKRILIHSYRMIANNLDYLLRVMVPPWVVGTFALFYLNQKIYGSPFGAGQQTGRQELVSGNDMLLITGGWLVYLFAMVWIVVGWHRFILLEEYSTGFWPKWHGDANLSYFGKSFLVGIVMMIPVMAFVMIASRVLGRDGWQEGLAGANPVPYVIGSFLVGTVVTYAFFRSALILPAAAVGKPMKLRDSWKITKDMSFDLIGVSVALSALSQVLSVPEMVFAGMDAVHFLATLVDSLLSLYSVSVLTTLYGHLVEGRELNA